MSNPRNERRTRRQLLHIANASDSACHDQTLRETVPTAHSFSNGVASCDACSFSCNFPNWQHPTPIATAATLQCRETGKSEICRRQTYWRFLSQFAAGLSAAGLCREQSHSPRLCRRPKPHGVQLAFDEKPLEPGQPCETSLETPFHTTFLMPFTCNKLPHRVAINNFHTITL